MAGRQIAEVCGRLLRPVSLELGGKSAAIILDDADLDLAKIGQNLFAATLVNNGLGGSVWTTDPARARHVVRQVRTGTMGINGYLPDPAGPWGGVKSSGLGRELGPGAIAAYQNLKTVYA